MLPQNKQQRCRPLPRGCGTSVLLPEPFRYAHFLTLGTAGAQTNSTLGHLVGSRCNEDQGRLNWQIKDFFHPCAISWSKIGGQSCKEPYVGCLKLSGNDWWRLAEVYNVGSIFNVLEWVKYKMERQAEKRIWHHLLTSWTMSKRMNMFYSSQQGQNKRGQKLW